MKIDDEIKELKEKLKNEKGREITVYSRIVGYFRPLSGWNTGKAKEYKERKEYIIK